MLISVARMGWYQVLRSNQGSLAVLRRCVLPPRWRPNAIIVIEFPDLERARAWYRSAEYAAALAVRDDAISRDLILVEGFG